MLSQTTASDLVIFKTVYLQHCNDKRLSVQSASIMGHLTIVSNT